jgi:hypothetical protein
MAHLPPRSALHGDGRTEHQAQRVDKDVLALTGRK